MNEPEYILEKHKYGWLLKPAPERRGVRMDCLDEITPMMPKDAVVHAGIANALGAIMAIGTDENCTLWKKEIDDDLAKQDLSPTLKWLRGTDTGLSSKAIFIALNENWSEKSEARMSSRGSPGHTPADASDFGRCQRLLDIMPEWEKPHMLNLVGMAYPGTAWVKIIPEWPRLKALYQREETLELNRELRKLNTPPP